jgi:hypothetical protein
VRGELNLREAVFYAQRKTRNYAKCQVTWWRKEPGLVWLRGFGDAPAIICEAAAKVRAFLMMDVSGLFCNDSLLPPTTHHGRKLRC